jgi:hypothetical protein
LKEATKGGDHLKLHPGQPQRVVGHSSSTQRWNGGSTS